MLILFHSNQAKKTDTRMKHRDTPSVASGEAGTSVSQLPFSPDVRACVPAQPTPPQAPTVTVSVPVRLISLKIMNRCQSVDFQPKRAPVTIKILSPGTPLRQIAPSNILTGTPLVQQVRFHFLVSFTRFPLNVA